MMMKWLMDVPSITSMFHHLYFRKFALFLKPAKNTYNQINIHLNVSLKQQSSPQTFLQYSKQYILDCFWFPRTDNVYFSVINWSDFYHQWYEEWRQLWMMNLTMAHLNKQQFGLQAARTLKMVLLNTTQEYNKCIAL